MASHWRALPTGTSPKAASPSISGARSERLSALVAHRAADRCVDPTICFSWRPASDAPAPSGAAPEAEYYPGDYLADYPGDYRLPWLRLQPVFDLGELRGCRLKASHQKPPDFKFRAISIAINAGPARAQHQRRLRAKGRDGSCCRDRHARGEVVSAQTVNVDARTNCNGRSESRAHADIILQITPHRDKANVINTDRHRSRNSVVMACRFRQRDNGRLVCYPGGIGSIAAVDL